jgi:PBSX family phage terminase large subunit
MMAIDFSEKQKAVWQGSITEKHRWNISYGATRSGKTYLDFYKIPYRIRNAGSDGLILLLGNTKGTLERNILDPLRQIWTPALVGNIGSNNKVRLFGRECWALGADKVNQISKLQGAGLVYCYGDEVTTWTEGVFQMLKSRLDKPGSCFDGTCNPDRPGHWFKKFLDSDADIFSISFTIDDNPFLLPSFVENLKLEYRGTVFYDRFILGRWVAAEGVIYRLLADNPAGFIVTEPPPIVFSTIGVDFGGSASAQAFQCTGFQRDLRGIVTLDEYFSKQPIDPAQLEAAFVRFVKKQMESDYRVSEIFCDSAEPVLIRGLRNALVREHIGIPVRNARKGSIVDRIRLYCALMGAGRYKIMSHCTHTIEAFATALWDAKSLDDQRLDDGTSNIDTLDAQEYSTESYSRRLLDQILRGGD